MSGIVSHPSNKNYRDNFDKVFKKVKKDCGCEDTIEVTEEEKQEEEEESDE